jgi:hypothetical protein
MNTLSENGFGSENSIKCGSGSGSTPPTSRDGDGHPGYAVPKSIKPNRTLSERRKGRLVHFANCVNVSSRTKRAVWISDFRFGGVFFGIFDSKRAEQITVNMRKEP